MTRAGGTRAWRVRARADGTQHAWTRSCLHPQVDTRGCWARSWRWSVTRIAVPRGQVRDDAWRHEQVMAVEHDVDIVAFMVRRLSPIHKVQHGGYDV